jgi:tripartite-type tricarboxylate transporter receptor subunit TctC
VLDNALRQVGEEFKKDTGQPLIIESKPGGGGIIAAQAVANAAPDGYTLLLASVSMMTVNPHLQQAALRPAQELSPDHRVLRLIAGDGRQRQRAGQQHQGIRRMGQGAKRPVSFASFTAGNTSHFMGVILNKRTGLDLVHVPFNGTPPAVQNLVGQQVDAAFLPLIAVKPQVEAGKVKVLAVSTPERSPIMPNVPTFKEQGYPDLTIHIWSSLAAPAGTPDAVVNKLNAAFTKILREPALRAKWAELDGVPMPMTPDEMTKLIQSDSSCGARRCACPASRPRSEPDERPHRPTRWAPSPRRRACLSAARAGGGRAHVPGLRPRHGAGRLPRLA